MVFAWMTPVYSASKQADAEAGEGAGYSSTVGATEARGRYDG
jgi:hypothetical protein